MILLLNPEHGFNSRWIRQNRPNLGEVAFDTLGESNYSPPPTGDCHESSVSVAEQGLLSGSTPPGPGMAEVTVPRQVLVVDGLSETATVLQAVLEPRGTVVQRTRSSSLRPSTDSSSDPDVVILDLDQPGEADQVSSRSWSQTPQVVIGSRRVKIDDAQTRFLQKPFQFPELIRAVEDLLNRSEND